MGVDYCRFRLRDDGAGLAELIRAQAVAFQSMYAAEENRTYQLDMMRHNIMKEIHSSDYSRACRGIRARIEFPVYDEAKHCATDIPDLHVCLRIGSIRHCLVLPPLWRVQACRTILPNCVNMLDGRGAAACCKQRQRPNEAHNMSQLLIAFVVVVVWLGARSVVYSLPRAVLIAVLRLKPRKSFAAIYRDTRRFFLPVPLFEPSALKRFLYYASGPAVSLLWLTLFGYLLFGPAPALSSGLRSAIELPAVVELLRLTFNLLLSLFCVTDVSLLDGCGMRQALRSRGKDFFAFHMRDRHADYARYVPAESIDRSAAAAFGGEHWIFERLEEQEGLEVLDHDKTASLLEQCLASDRIAPYERGFLTDLFAGLVLKNNQWHRAGRALAHVERALAMLPDCATLNGTKGSLLMELGRADEGKRLLEPLLADGNNNIDRHIAAAYLARDALRQGNLDAARALFAQSGEKARELYFMRELAGLIEEKKAGSGAG